MSAFMNFLKKNVTVKNVVLSSLFIFSLSTVFLPVVAQAGITLSAANGYQTIIPCGNSNSSGQGAVTRDCTFADLLTFFVRFINFALKILVTISILAFMYAGFLYLQSAVSPEKRSQAKAIFSNILWGLFWVIGAYFLVKFIIVGLVSPEIANRIFN